MKNLLTKIELIDAIEAEIGEHIIVNDTVWEVHKTFLHGVDFHILVWRYENLYNFGKQKDDIVYDKFKYHIFDKIRVIRVNEPTSP